MRKKHSIESVPQNKEEIFLKGRPVSRGIGIGKTLCLHGRKRQFYKVKVNESRVAKEIGRFQNAVELASKQLEEISSPDSERSIGENQAGIFETHQMFLADKSLQTSIENAIIEQKVNAEWAIKVVVDSYVARYKALSNEHLREKYIDLEDVAERLFSALSGNTEETIEFDSEAIIIAEEVHPSTLIEISEKNPKALVTQSGGWTSHTFILARELGIPAVTGVKNILRRVESADKIVVDGFSGNIVLNPTAKRIKEHQAESVESLESKLETSANDSEPLKTLDGFEVAIRTNLEVPEKYQQAANCGAKGVGLYRSEFLFNRSKRFPTEDEQFQSYLEMGEVSGEHGVRIRTFDLGFDEISRFSSEKEKNPALGLRGIRLGKEVEREFRIQLRALLRASAENPIDIVLPMISDVSEIHWARKILNDEHENLVNNKISVGEPQVGAMIEVPAAVFAIDKIIEASDFLSVGTNDLVQYVLAVDRDNENVADWFQTLHPAILKCVKIVLQGARKAKKSAIVCGEMAGSPLYIPILIGYGAEELSMNTNSISRVRNIVSNIAQEESIELVNELETCGTADEVEKLVRRKYLENWEHLFAPENLPSV